MNVKDFKAKYGWASRGEELHIAQFKFISTMIEKIFIIVFYCTIVKRTALNIFSAGVGRYC